MCTILSIETATPVCSCTLSRDGEIILNREDFRGQSHATLLGQFVHEIMAYVRANSLTPDAIAVSSGPGSYTGLRIGVSEAKGLSYGLGIPMIALPTSLIMASMIADRVGEDELLCPMIDARRMEVYSELFDKAGNSVREVRAEIIDVYSFQEFLADYTVVFAGEGAEKCKPSLAGHPNALFLDGFMASAVYMADLSETKFRQKQFENLAYFEPFYLKEFVAGKPRVKGLS